MSSVPQTYTISDFIEWFKKRQLILDPNFQRGTVWTNAAKVFLIDTILNEFPMPQIYFRTKIDAMNQSTVREVVDGQQRLRAILDFAAGKLRLTSKAPEFKDKVYSDLSSDDQEKFLGYRIPVVQLLNASDSDVLEVFARLNSYSVKVTPAELRHAEFSEPVKWSIYEACTKWRILWSDFAVVGTRDSVRLRHTSLMAELFMTIDVGLNDGGENIITRYYDQHRETDETHFLKISAIVDEVIDDILKNLPEEFRETTFLKAPNFLILFAVVAFLKGKGSCSRVTADVDYLFGLGVDWEKMRRALTLISKAFDDADSERSPSYADFIEATRSSTHRVASRKTRFSVLTRAVFQNEAIV